MIGYESKKMSKYLLECVGYFKNTGLWITTYLDEEGLQRRKQERENFRKSTQYSRRDTNGPNRLYNNNKNRLQNNTLVNNTNSEVDTNTYKDPEGRDIVWGQNETHSFRA